MARGSLPAVLLLLLGFVEAVDIKGEKIIIIIYYCRGSRYKRWELHDFTSQAFISSYLSVKEIIIHVFSWASADAKAHFSSVWISFPLLPRMSFSKCKEFLLQNLSQFCHFSLWTIRLNLYAPRRLQGMRFLNRSIFLFQLFLHFSNFSCWMQQGFRG